ncbi:MAG: site-specific tyrosine recombinase XerC [Schlesneria sp.]|nr:site-specific tyrosine recombinase XerC [Schlesneria sp.]
MSRKAKPQIWRDKYVTYVGGNRKILCQLDAGEQHANEKFLEYKGELKAKAEGRLRLIECVAEYLEHNIGTLSRRTCDDYRSRLDRLAKYYGQLELCNFKPSHAEAYFRRLKRDELGIVTINRHVQAAKALFNFAVARSWIAENPCDALKQVKEFWRQRIVTDEEFAKLLTACDEPGSEDEMENAEVPMMKDILRVLRRTALRPGELRILRYDHLRLNDGLIIIPPSEHKTGRTSRVPKPRVVPFLDDVKEILLRRQAVAGACRSLFPGPKGKPWMSYVLSREFKRLRRKAGLDEPVNGEKLCLYHLRHTRITEIATEEDWSNPALLSEYAGNSPTITNRYIKVNSRVLGWQLRRGEATRLDQLRA